MLSLIAVQNVRKIIRWLGNKMKLLCTQKRHENRAVGYNLTLMTQLFVTVEIITILCFMARQQLSALQNWQWETLKRGKLKYMQKNYLPMPISANKDKRTYQIAWKRWKKFQGNESLVWLIHTSWIKVLSCNLKKYLVSEVSSSRRIAFACTKHQTSLHDLGLSGLSLQRKVKLICKFMKESTGGTILSGTFHLLALLNTKPFSLGVPK